MHRFALMFLGLSVVVPPESLINIYISEMNRISESTGIDPGEKSRIIPRNYLERVKSLQVMKSGLSDEGMHKLFTLTGAAFFYSQFSDFDSRQTILRDLNDDVVELERRSAATDDEIAELYRGFVSIRDFNAARKLFDRHPGAGLVDVPVRTQAPGFDQERPAVYSLAADGQYLHLHNVAKGDGDFIVVVAQCHLARDAAIQIASDPELRDAFKRGRVVWLQSSTESLNIVELKAWNDVFPDQPLSIAFDDKAWVGIDFSRSPGFFFFKQGKLISRHEGWSKTTSKAGLEKSLRRLGLLGR